MRRLALRLGGGVLFVLAVGLAILAFTRPVASHNAALLSVLLGLVACSALLGSFACFSRAGR